MSSRFLNRLLAATAILAAAVAWSPSAMANLELFIESPDGNGNQLIIASNATPETISFSGMDISSGQDSSLTLSVTSNSNTPGASGSPAISSIITSASLTNLTGAAVNVILFLTDTNFSIPPGPFVGSNVTRYTHTVGAIPTSVTFQTFADSGNKLFATTGTVTTNNPPAPSGTTPGVQSFSSGQIPPGSPSSLSAPFAASSANSLTTRIGFNNAPNAGTYTINGSSTIYSPEPSTLAMAFAGLPLAGLGLARRLRNRRSMERFAD